jgi:hypothetical protein
VTQGAKALKEDIEYSWVLRTTGDTTGAVGPKGIQGIYRNNGAVGSLGFKELRIQCREIQNVRCPRVTQRP